MSARAAARWPSAGRSLWIVKLGGSLATSRALRPWLAAIADGAGRLVLVPGGGPFADTVRRMQRRCGFDDATAHHLALMAMEQYGLMLAGLEPRLKPASTPAQIARLIAAESVPVWMPTRMTLGRPDIPQSWDMTSDSLAAWLAAELGAAGLLLVKSAAIPAGAAVDELARRGIVDPLLPAFLARGVGALRCLEAGDPAALAGALATGGSAAPGPLGRGGRAGARAAAR
ncbi:MAG: hypothetical protein IRY94_01635 [Rhodospirillaceae bacterium]|nr:hypothetical protein [Rhodospirillaceae bacterium]